MLWTAGIGLASACIGVTDPPTDGPPKDVSWTDAANAAYAGTWSFEPIEIPEASNVSIDWSELTEDLSGVSLDPAKFGLVALVEMAYPLDGLEAALAEDTISSSDYGSVAHFSPEGATDAAVGAFEILTSPFQVSWLVVDPSRTWLLALGNGDDNIGARMLAVLAPTASATNGVAYVTQDAARWTTSFDFGTGLAVPAGSPEFQLDFSRITMGLYGRGFDPSWAYTLVLAHFDAPVDEVEADFPGMFAADQTYSIDVDDGITQGPLSGATDEQGRTFPGFTSEGTWLVGTACSDCLVPLPPLLAWARVEG